jgi:hypothetical protein
MRSNGQMSSEPFPMTGISEAFQFFWVLSYFLWEPKIMIKAFMIQELSRV